MGNYVCRKCYRYKHHQVAVRGKDGGLILRTDYNYGDITLFGCLHDYQWVVLEGTKEQESYDFKRKVDTKEIYSSYNLDNKTYDSTSVHFLQKWFIRMTLINRLKRTAKNKKFIELWWHPDHKGGYFHKKSMMVFFQEELGIHPFT